MAESRIVKIVIHCGTCDKEVEPKQTYFDTESDGRSCPGCDGSGGQYTCLCGGANITKSLQFQCPNCNFWGTIYVE